MININTLFEAVCRIINKQAHTAYKDFNRFIVQAELQLYKERLGLPEEYQPGRPVPRVAQAMTQKVSDDLRSFLVEAPLKIDTKGSAPLPADYARLTAIRSNLRSVKVVEHALLGEYHLDSQLCPPTAKHPICAFYAERLQFYPVDLAAASMEYYRFPKESKWAFTLDENGRPGFDRENSVDSEFPKDCTNDLIVRVCSFFGVSIKASDIMQYADTKQRQGI